MSTNNSLKDDSPMPFGRYARQGYTMEEVPANYLMYLYDQMKDEMRFEIDDSDRGKVFRYIVDNMDVLDKELNND